MRENILVNFSKKIFLATFILLLLSSGTIYYMKKSSLNSRLGSHIKKHLDVCKSIDTSCFDANSSLTSTTLIKHIKMVGFSFFKIYTKDTKQVYSYKNPQINTKFSKILQEDIEKKFINLQKYTDVKYDFLQDKEKHYYLSVIYPIYKNDFLKGYIIGYKHIQKEIIEDGERDIYHVIFTVIFSIFIFTLTVFPIIYNAYNKLKKSRKKLLLSNIETIHILGNAIALRDSDTNEHNFRVSIYAVKFAKYLGLDIEQIQKLILGSFLHDVGKIGISDTILLKNGKLSDAEFEIMKEHVLKGIALVGTSEWLDNAKEIIANHHEKYDGSGYPYGVKGEKIPLIARVFSIIDVFDALTSKRPYKESFSYEKSISILLQESGTHFDAHLLKKFLEIAENLYKTTTQMNPNELQNELNTIIDEYFIADMI